MDNRYKESAMLGVYQAASTTMEIPIDVNNLRDEQHVYVLVAWESLVYDIEKVVDVNGVELTMKNNSGAIVDSLRIGHGDILWVQKYRTTVSVYVAVSLSSIIDRRIAAADSALVTALSEVYEE